VVNNKISQISWVVSKQVLANKMAHNQFFLRNGIMQYAILGNSTRAFNATVGAWLKRRVNITLASTNDIFDLSSDGKDFIPNQELKAYFNHISNHSLCESFD
jgi:hypothetical protein